MSSILITGAGEGIGHATALRLADDGHQVFAGVLDPGERDRLEHPNVVAVVLDVTDAASIEAAVGTVRASTDGLDGLVNNAGIGIGGPIEVVPLDWFREQFEVNVFGAVAVTQAFLPLVRARTGRIVNVTSVGANLVSPLHGPYCGSKHALRAISSALRMELSVEGIHVAEIEPGPVKTAIWGKAARRNDRLTALLPAPQSDRYLPMIDNGMEAIARSESQGVDTARVSNAIAHALLHRRPRIRYRVGPVAIGGSFARWLLPDRWMEWFLKKDAGVVPGR